MWERLQHMLIKEFIQILRDPRMKAVIFVTPLLQLLVFGYAVTTDITQITMAVSDFDHTQESRELVRRFESSGYFRVVQRVGEARALQELIDRGTVKAALQFDPGFTRDLKRGRSAVVQVLVDGTDSNTAGVVMDYANRIIAQYNRQAAHEALAVREVAMGTPPADALRPRLGEVDLRSRAWYNPDLRSRNYNVPAVIAIIIMLTSLLLTSMAIVREREIGTMEQLMVTPIRPAELILGKTLPFALIGFFDVALITTAAVFWFTVPIRGSLLLLFGATALYLLSTLGIGLFISTVSKTQQQALMSTFFFYLPAVLLSGFMFPIANMPVAVQYLTYVNPLRYFLVIIRGVFLKGNGPAVLWPQMLALAILGAVLFTASTLRFQKRLE
ncbi:MAG: ABC transporter permease [Candidatus Methylomirabilota bacterium]|nr:ABC transporter permease [candidate division NC10 bacterium]PWB48702.1 MAG: ABC transporter permease [candidate division NC10 bacterium]